MQCISITLLIKFANSILLYMYMKIIPKRIYIYIITAIKFVVTSNLIVKCIHIYIFWIKINEANNLRVFWIDFSGSAATFLDKSFYVMLSVATPLAVWSIFVCLAFVHLFMKVHVVSCVYEMLWYGWQRGKKAE